MRTPSLRTPAVLLSLAFGGLLAACTAHDNPYFDARVAHHRPDGFQNRYLAFKPRGLAELARWRLDAALEGLPRPAASPVPTVAVDHAFLARNAAAGPTMEPAITWLGHATMLVQAGGLNWLTDPMFSERASPLGFVGPRRAKPPALTAAQLPHIDAVLISHNHYDHLDVDSVLALNAQQGGPPVFIVPLGLKPWLAERGIANAVELDWWSSHRVGAAEVVLTPVQHWSGRGLTDRLKTLWGGFAVFTPNFQFFFGGDTGYSPDFKDIRQRFVDRQADGGFDLALLPVGAYEPRWFMREQHVNPDESVQIHLDLQAKRSVGLHWGTFELTDESLDEPPLALQRARRARGLADEAFTVMAVGETRRFSPRPPQQAAQAR